MTRRFLIALLVIGASAGAAFGLKHARGAQRVETSLEADTEIRVETVRRLYENEKVVKGEEVHEPNAQIIEKHVPGQWVSYSRKSENVEAIKATALRLTNEMLATPLSSETTVLKNIYAQKASGTNYRVCFHIEGSNDFIVTFAVPINAHLGDESEELIGLGGIHTRYNKDSAKVMCEERVDGDDIEHLESLVGDDDMGSSDDSVSPDEHPTMRFLRRRVELGEADVPASFDWRDEDGRACKAQIEQVYDQGHCGSCYGHAVTATLADRTCIAAKKKGARMDRFPIRLSAQDYLACGTREHGNFCQFLVGDRKETRYANNCDGGSLIKAHEFARDKGLKDDSCHPFDPKLDEVKPGDFDIGQPTGCAILTHHGFPGGEIGCDRRYYTLDEGHDVTYLSNQDFCSCPYRARFFKPQNGERVAEWPEAMFEVTKMHRGQTHCVVVAKAGATKRTSIGCKNPEQRMGPFSMTPFDEIEAAVPTPGKTAVDYGAMKQGFRNDRGQKWEGTCGRFAHVMTPDDRSR